MGKSLVCNSRVSGYIAGNISTTYLPISGGGGAGDPTAEDCLFRLRTAGTFSGAWALFSATGTSRSVQFRKNTANGNLVISPPDSTSGWFGDATHSDHAAAGDYLDWLLSPFHVTNGGVFSILAAFEADSGHAAIYSEYGSQAWASPSTVYFGLPPAGTISLFSTEAEGQIPLRVAGTVKNFQCQIWANNRNGTTTFRVRKNGADGNCYLSIGSNQSGFFEDTSSTDTVASGDATCVRGSLGGSSGTMTIGMVGCVIETTSDKNDIVCNTASSSWGPSQTGYLPVAGGAAASLTESSAVRTKHPFNCLTSRMRAHVTVNTFGNASTGYLRKNGSNVSQTITVGANQTGWFEDTTHTDDIEAGDELGYVLTAGSTASQSLTTNYWALTEEYLGGVSGSLAATEALDAAAFEGVGSASGTLTATDAADAAAFAGDVTGVAGTFAATEALDVASVTGNAVSINKFDQYSLGDGDLADWSKPTGTFTVTIAGDNSNQYSGRSMSTTPTAAGWYAWDAPGSGTDCELLALVQIPGALTANAEYPTIALRQAASAATNYCDGGATNASAQGTIERLSRYSNGTRNTIASFNFSWSADTWYWIRLRAIGTAIKSKMWADGSAEPGTWDNEATDANIASGKVAIRTSRSIGWLGVAWGDYTIPLPLAGNVGSFAVTESIDTADIAGVTVVFGQLETDDIADASAFAGLASLIGALDADEAADTTGGGYGDTALLMHCDGADGSTTFVDSTSRHTTSAQGNAQIDTAQSLFGGASGFLDGTGDYVQVPAHDDFNFGTGDFTVDLRVRFRTAPSGTLDIGSLVSGLGPVNGDWMFAAVYQAGQKLGFGRNIVAWDLQSASLTWNANQWYHLAATRSDGTLRLFRDGTIVATGTNNTFAYNIGTNLAIGARQETTGQSTPGRFIDGWVDEIRIIKGRAVWTANFTPPTQPYAPSEGFTGFAQSSGTLDTDEAPDVSAFAGLSGRIGALAVTEQPDVSQFVALVSRIGTLASTEAADIADFEYTDFGTLLVIDATDVAAFVGSTARQGSMVAHETADAIAVEGLIGLTGFYSVLEEARDTGAFVGSLGQVGTLGISELEDAAAFNAEISYGPKVYVALDRSEPDDQTALFSNFNDDLKIEVDGLSLVGRSVPLRGDAETIIPQRPLILTQGQLVLDADYLDEVLGSISGLEGSLSETLATLGAAAQLDVATVAEVQAGADGVLFTPKTVFDAQAFQSLTDASPIVWDQNAGFNFTVSLTANRQLAFPSNPKVGQSGFIEIVQPSGGGKVLTFASGFLFDAGLSPSIDTGTLRKTLLFYFQRSLTECLVGSAFIGFRSAP